MEVEYLGEVPEETSPSSFPFDDDDDDEQDDEKTRLLHGLQELKGFLDAQTDEEPLLRVEHARFACERLARASPEMQADRDVALAALSLAGAGLFWVAEALREDKAVVLAAVSSWGDALLYASAALKADREVVLEAVKRHGRALRFADESIQDDREVVLRAVSDNGDALQFASSRLREDKEVVLKAVQNGCLALQHAADSLRADAEIVAEAAAFSSHTLRMADSRLLEEDGSLVIRAIQHRPSALQFAPEECRCNPDVVLVAVESNGLALQFASEALKSNREVVRMAIRNGAGALEFAGKDMKGDKDLVLLAARMSNDATAWHRMASDDLQAWISFGDFRIVYEIPLACPGQMAPMINVIATEEDDGSYSCTGTLASGTAVQCSVTAMATLGDVASALAPKVKASVNDYQGQGQGQGQGGPPFSMYLIFDGQDEPASPWDHIIPLCSLFDE
mmetsp:Transcript_9212/g.20388  ORF Transcript_9212/g.20388 Transcript_9212/m.20388 type:complete len:451 (+) Transcript_9212:158-1510(+)